MAEIGTITDLGANTKQIVILASATATNGPPAQLTDGIAIDTIRSAFGGTFPEVVKLVVRSTAGSGTMTFTLRLWELNGDAATDWGPSGGGTESTAGILNDGQAYAETGTNVIKRSEPVYGLSQCNRVYVEITAISGTATAVEVCLQAELASARAQ